MRPGGLNVGKFGDDQADDRPVVGLKRYLVSDLN